MKECNKNLYNNLIDYLKKCDENYVEIFVEYKDEEFGHKSLIMQYNKTVNGGWLGYCINIFDYDFYDIYEIISFTPITNLTIIDEDKVLKN